MSLYDFTKSRCPELAEYLAFCCTAELRFEGDHPNDHSADNYIHLWALEWWADHHSWIDLGYRTEFVGEIFARWRGRLKGLPPYRDRGYRLYLYEDMSPTISVTAETDFGFAYDHVEAKFVGSTRELMALYADRGWRKNFEFSGWACTRNEILDAVDANHGSISKPTASKLGLKVGKLRTLIEQMGLDREVNSIRKRYKRRPAKFRPDDELPYSFHVYETMLPAGY